MHGNGTCTLTFSLHRQLYLISLITCRSVYPLVHVIPMEGKKASVNDVDIGSLLPLYGLQKMGLLFGIIVLS